MPSNSLKVKVIREKLLEKLNENLKTHKADYDKALKGWMETIRRACVATIQDIDEGKLETLKRIVDHHQRPDSHEKDYKLAIAMVEWHDAEHIELDQHDFDRYVQDNWEWKDQWTSSNSRYARYKH